MKRLLSLVAGLGLGLAFAQADPSPVNLAARHSHRSPSHLSPLKRDSLEWLDPLLADYETEFDHLAREYAGKREPLSARLADVKKSLANPCNRTPETGFDLLWEKSQLDDALAELAAEADLKLTKLRYRKSIDIVKTLYEKVLSIDHHFSSLKAHQKVMQLSNPHNYPDFKETRELLDEKMKKKFGFELPLVLQTNPFVSAAWTVVSMVTGGGEKDKKPPADMEKIACILDFTVKMHQDLSVVFYETEYLREANITLKNECEALFVENARQVGYTIPLENCRDSDDWERLYALLDNLINKVTGLPNNPASADPVLALKATTNLQFAIDRTVRFIDKYAAFVGQGGDYYKKFDKIVAGYDNTQTCAASLPAQFKQLKDDIRSTLDKFNSAYRLPEMQGSRLKDLMYGISE